MESTVTEEGLLFFDGCFALFFRADFVASPEDTDGLWVAFPRLAARNSWMAADRVIPPHKGDKRKSVMLAEGLLPGDLRGQKVYG